MNLLQDLIRSKLIPSGDSPSPGPSPTGTIEITENGTYDVTQYAEANVNVPAGPGPFQLLKTVTVESGVSSVEITLPSGFSEFGLVIDAMFSASCKKSIFHTSVASSRNMADSATNSAWSGVCKIISADHDSLGETAYGQNRCATFGDVGIIGKIVSYGIPETLIISIVSGTATFTSGTIEVWGR